MLCNLVPCAHPIRQFTTLCVCVHLLMYLFFISAAYPSGGWSGLTAASSVTVSDPSSPNRHGASV